MSLRFWIVGMAATWTVYFILCSVENYSQPLVITLTPGIVTHSQYPGLPGFLKCHILSHVFYHGDLFWICLPQASFYRCLKHHVYIWDVVISDAVFWVLQVWDSALTLETKFLALAQVVSLCLVSWDNDTICFMGHYDKKVIKRWQNSSWNQTITQ